MRIAHVLASAGLGGYFFDDQRAIKDGALRDGIAYLGPPVTPGFAAVREPAESTSVMLVLDDGYVAVGDCASVQYSGVGGREPRLRGAELAARIECDLAPRLSGLEVTSFREASERAEALLGEIGGFGRAAAYGVSQALLDAAAHAAGHHLMGRVVKDEWDLPGPLQPVPLYAQTGENRINGVDTMILKRLPVLPHGLINTPDLVGANGAALLDYIGFIRGRIARLAPQPGYLPVIHLDVYGLVGLAAGGSIARTADIIERLEDAAGPHALRVEHPIDAGGRDLQIAALSALRAELTARGSRVQIIADEWANTLADIAAFVSAGAADLIQIKTPDLGALHHIVDAVLLCHDAGVGSVLGGTCAETDRSARATTHIGIATGVTQLLAKPGMGIDEGVAIVANEMNRAVRLDRLVRRCA